jgi:hypothetical protein
MKLFPSCSFLIFALRLCPGFPTPPHRQLDTRPLSTTLEPQLSTKRASSTLGSHLDFRHTTLHTLRRSLHV